MTEKFDSITSFVRKVFSLIGDEKDSYKRSSIVNNWLEDNNVELSTGNDGITISSQTAIGKLLTYVLAQHAIQFDEIGLLNREALF